MHRQPAPAGPFGKRLKEGHGQLARVPMKINGRAARAPLEEVTAGRLEYGSIYGGLCGNR